MTLRRKSAVLCGVASAMLVLTGWPRHAMAQASPPMQAPLLPASKPLKTVTVAEGLDHPWSIAFMPDFASTGRVLVTERPGRLRLLDLRSNQAGAQVSGVPEVVARGQGGLFDVLLDPKFAENALVYLSYFEAGEGGSGIAVARARLDAATGAAPALRDLKVIFRERPKAPGNANLGGRLVFAPDGKLFITVGDRFGLRDQAQDPAVLHGKLVRIEADGRVPADNPYVNRAGAAPEIWNIGHRNAQGIAFQPGTGELWSQEHGPQGGDEVNVEAPGKNYGWPVITYGAEYGTGAKIGEGTEKAGMEQPLTYWVPSIAPSGMAFLSSDRYPGWKGSLFIGALRGETLVRLPLEGHRVLGQERLLEQLGERIRDVRQGPDGWLYVLTDNSRGRVLRLEPQ